MRIPFPERIPYGPSTAFAVALTVLQLVEHTDPVFAICSCAYIMVATAAFNLAGGIYRAPGTYVFFNSLLVFIIGVSFKAVLREPAQKNLISAPHTAEIYLLSMLGILIAVFIESQTRTSKPILATKFPLTDLGGAYRGAVVIGSLLTLLFLLPINVQSGSFLSLMRNTNVFLPFAIILGVLRTVKDTNGQKSTTPSITVLIVVTTLIGFTTFSKQAMFTPMFAWFLGAAVARYQLKLGNIILLGIIVFLAASYATPYSQYGRNLSKGTFLGNAQVAVGFFEHPVAFKALYVEDAEEQYGSLNYYDQPEGLFDRLQFICIDDALMHVTDTHGTFGYLPIEEGFENLVPHFFWPNKPIPYFGNTYAHEIGGLDDNDITTGVSFSIAADAYHEGGLTGVLVGIPLGLVFVFSCFSFLVGSVRDHPAALILTLTLAHSAAEGGFYGIFAMLDIALLVVGVGFICQYLFPIAASVFEPQRLADTAMNPEFTGA